ncbi:hypothetical protein GGR54DRAFT_535129 [Hypoxylon sp. NC1633]|nr:hypothetical protein GGR54DRAFT_535129 [Hypoxylon sp. NC1633]
MMSTPTRRQPLRAARTKHLSSPHLPQSPLKKHALKSGVRKASARSPTKRGGKYPKGGRARLARELENRVSLLDSKVARIEQHELLGAPIDLVSTSPARTDLPNAKSAKKKRGRGKKKPESEMYMDDILLSDKEEDEGDKAKEVVGDGRLRREDRWIPDMEHRGKRPEQKPKLVPYQVWMSYCLLDDYIYRNSLTADQIRKHPLMDEVYSFQNGGQQPVTPAGFQWDGRQRLVPIQENATGN